MLVVLAVVAAALQTMSAGIHVLGVAALNPAWRELDGPTYLAVKQAADRRFPALMRPFTLLGLAAVVALTVACAVTGSQPSGALAAAGAVAAVVGLLAVVRGDLPINQRMANWSADALPVDWQEERRRWERWFALRTGAALVAAGACLAALVAVGGQG
ncbi:protein of unknown function [Klenkia soli]|uniref:DUF1772 domain-containing protein n=1 Tax=Klenkia soli TaxID=1052260 RepID=A0A1H0NFR0_9ACTN|nr:DUF1772 domain-containing protein [Klenkia soli]SDO91539.1 protein of unknown function [Klenkia soli]